MDHIKYAFIALLGWGIWAIGTKLLTRFFNTPSISFWISFWSILFLSIFLAFRRNLMVNTYVLYTVPIGFVTIIAMLAFYKALKIGPTSVVIPLTNMYLIFPVLFGFIVLKEPLTMQRVLGIAFALVATILLSL
ncbi:MAG: EamA family transporter [candidate division WOR-3 bacterium]|nr:MAG: EamA family transporter [candidate division WOR-3 bacterium]